MGSATNYPGRYLAIGFDDFRLSDFSLVFPLFHKYDARATYNRIAYQPKLTSADVSLIHMLVCNGNELGDHSWFHCNYIYNDPLFNGQNPDCTEGEQEIFPSNRQLREDRGDGKNAFGFSLSDDIEKNLWNWNIWYRWTAFKSTWEDLTDDQCQAIREHFSIYADTSGMLDVLDFLSNKYLGTKGKSKDSWNAISGCYTGGIFTGARTSCNHEIWERLLEVTNLFYKQAYSNQFYFTTWSWPGSVPSPFVFERNGKRYYDEKCSVTYNFLARFPSSYLLDKDGGDLKRSWIEVLRSFGYKITHDTEYPSRDDGQALPMMSKRFIYNARFSRKDALPYSGIGSIVFSEANKENLSTIDRSYPQEFFDPACGKSMAAQMYDAGGQFFNFIECIRHETSNGMIHEEVIDSVDTYSERIFLTQILEYCRVTGVDVITKKRAYDICFSSVNFSGNLIYNPSLRNTAREFMPDAKNIVQSPDGYRGGDVREVHGIPTLVVNGSVEYLHYGIPVGKLAYTANIRGEGKIDIYAIKNATKIEEVEENNIEKLGGLSLSNAEFLNRGILFTIKDYPETDYEQLCEGLGEKVMGIKIVYVGEMEINQISLCMNSVV